MQFNFIIDKKILYIPYYFFTYLGDKGTSAEILAHTILILIFMKVTILFRFVGMLDLLEHDS